MMGRTLTSAVPFARSQTLEIVVVGQFCVEALESCPIINGLFLSLSDKRSCVVPRQSVSVTNAY